MNPASPPPLGRVPLLQGWWHFSGEACCIRVGGRRQARTGGEKSPHNGGRVHGPPQLHPGARGPRRGDPRPEGGDRPPVRGRVGRFDSLEPLLRAASWPQVVPGKAKVFSLSLCIMRRTEFMWGGGVVVVEMPHMWEGCGRGLRFCQRLSAPRGRNETGLRLRRRQPLRPQHRTLLRGFRLRRDRMEAGEDGVDREDRRGAIPDTPRCLGVSQTSEEVFTGGAGILGLGPRAAWPYFHRVGGTQGHGPPRHPRFARGVPRGVVRAVPRGCRGTRSRTVLHLRDGSAGQEGLPVVS